MNTPGKGSHKKCMYITKSSTSNQYVRSRTVVIQYTLDKLKTFFLCPDIVAWLMDDADFVLLKWHRDVPSYDCTFTFTFKSNNHHTPIGKMYLLTDNHIIISIHFTSRDSWLWMSCTFEYSTLHIIYEHGTHPSPLATATCQNMVKTWYSD